MEIKGAGQFNGYNAQHIGVVQREIAHSVKPNVLRQLDEKDLTEEAFERLLAEDLVDLSPEAKEMLKNLRKQRKGKNRRHDDALEAPRQDFLSLLAGLEEFRKQTEESGNEDEDPLFKKPPQKPKPFLPPVIALSTHVPRPEVAAALAGGNRGPSLNRAGDLARKMVAIAPRPELKDQMALEMQVFGEEIIAQCKQFGVRAVILGPHTALTDLKINGMHVVAPTEKTFDGRLWTHVRGLYDPSRRMLVVGEELLGHANRSTTRHEFAHAYDHVFSQKNHRKLPLSVQLWNMFRHDRTGLVSDYAGTNPAEYFAESVEAFFQANAREGLRQSDPGMFDYLDKLFP